jgi:predicted DNA-binding transcriptional regulator AlpA
MPNSTSIDRLVTAREAMLLLGVRSTTLYKFCRNGMLSTVKFSQRCTRYRLSEIEALIDTATKKGGAQ